MKRLTIEPELLEATIDYYPVIQNMARFYVYDMSRCCGHLPGWELPKNGLYDSFDFKNYFLESDRSVFLIRLDNEIAGFVMINKITNDQNFNWNIGEFFVLAKFQKQGIGKKTAFKIWNNIKGNWEVSVIPDNQIGLDFWNKIIYDYTKGGYVKNKEKVNYDREFQERTIFRFSS